MAREKISRVHGVAQAWERMPRAQEADRAWENIPRWIGTTIPRGLLAVPGRTGKTPQAQGGEKGFRRIGVTLPDHKVAQAWGILRVSGEDRGRVATLQVREAALAWKGMPRVPKGDRVEGRAVHPLPK